MAGDAADIAIEVYENERSARSKRFDKLCNDISAKGLVIKRYNYSNNKEQFKSNKDIWILIAYAGIEMLPATYVDSHLMKIEAYPTRAEFDKWCNSVNTGGN